MGRSPLPTGLLLGSRHRCHLGGLWLQGRLFRQEPHRARFIKDLAPWTPRPLCSTFLICSNIWYLLAYRGAGGAGVPERGTVLWASGLGWALQERALSAPLLFPARFFCKAQGYRVAPLRLSLAFPLPRPGQLPWPLWAPGVPGAEEEIGVTTWVAGMLARAVAASPAGVQCQPHPSAAAPGSLHVPLKTSCPEGRSPQEEERKCK